jgi:twitching motility protein PilT
LESSNVDIHRLLQTMVEKGASDLHLTAASPPCLRINGKIYALKTRPLEGPELEMLAYSILSERQKKEFEETNEVDMSFRWKGAARFRANFYRQQGFVAGAIRSIPTDVRTLTELGIPSAANDLLDRAGGLILVTGPTGSGKSTTLASFVDGYNSRHRGHIITVEDPIEFVHSHKKCIVNQREVGSDTQSFKSALRYVLRQDPDAVLIGEIRDLDTMEAVLALSETGHLTFATLHTNNCVQTIHRILDFFPPKQQEMVRTQISFVLEGILSQQLLPSADGRGRVLACELLVPNGAIRNLIRENKTHQIYSQMQMGQTRHGMQTLNQCLLKLVTSRQIAKEDAIQRSYDPEELTTMLMNAAVAAPPNSPRRR